MNKIAVLDFGGQYAHLIANRIRRLGVYTEILDPEVLYEKLLDYKGIVLSGGPSSVIDPKSIKCDKRVFELGVPILGICYGHQLAAYLLGGEVEKGNVREYGKANVHFLDRKGIFEGVEDYETVWMSHFDQVVKLPDGFEVVASTDDCPIAAMTNYEKNIYCMQFHPEVTHTPCGKMILENFVNITDSKREWNIDTYLTDIINQTKEKAGDKNVFLMVSGGVDSTVAFMLLDKAIGQEKVYGLFVDTGFLRMNERVEVENALKGIGVQNLHVYDASEEYFKALENVYDPEEKRKIIGNLFLDIQAKVADKLGLNPDEWMFGQGTIYPDTIESAGTKYADKIKTHHNRVERIQKLIEQSKVIEPLAQLYKDEVRIVGEKLGLAKELVNRHPFPGPGLAVRCLCAIGPDYPENYQDVEAKINEVVSADSLSAKILPIKSVGVQGDERTYRRPVLLYGKRDSWNGLDKTATRLTNQFPQVNRVLFALMPQKIEEMSIQKKYLIKDRILTIQKADKIVMDYISEAKIDMDIWQFPTVLIPVDLDSRGGESIVLRPVCSQEAMTANFYQMDFDKLDELVKRLSAVSGISGIFYDITNKPPGTIEWE
ncbi:glutamine-hydrolyzing GMP synthase [Candidatus Peregrinibacteria bacterium]|nr:glutamine-hydrolyzing GMP synthase [Candidatus Peregrinibacteria bacterium]